MPNKLKQFIEDKEKELKPLLECDKCKSMEFEWRICDLMCKECGGIKRYWSLGDLRQYQLLQEIKTYL